MGMLVEGRWTDADPIQETGKDGDFRRVDSVYREFITADGSTGFRAERGRYHLYVAHGCPWAHRTVIYRSIKKLKDLISIAYAIPGLSLEGWTYEDNPAFPDCTPDRVNSFHYLHEAYTETDAFYTGKVTVPVLWDKKSGRIVNNESADIIRMLNTEFARYGADPTDFYPAPLRADARFAGLNGIVDFIYAWLFSLFRGTLNGHAARSVHTNPHLAVGLGRQIELERAMERVIVSVLSAVL